MSALSPTYHKTNRDFSPLPDHILVYNMEKGDKITAGGIIVIDDNGKDRGIRPRWAQVYKVGKNIKDVEPGQWVLVKHGRWTWGVDVSLADGDAHVQRVDPEGILGVQDTKPF